MECRAGRVLLFCRRCHGTGGWAIAEVEIHVILILITILMVIIPVAILSTSMGYLVRYIFSLRLRYVFRYRRRYGSCNRGLRWSQSGSGCRCRCRGSRAVVIVIAVRMLANVRGHTHSSLDIGGAKGALHRLGDSRSRLKY
ncbi:hypothetical protein F5Y12DRAFT_543266 [Xylaria sp. FL1777]|nr:hypothetical protein F5Y12DRAFT_543266 [Xylaria sp. FL1777]